jgi:hypothetical protein
MHSLDPSLQVLPSSRSALPSTGVASASIALDQNFARAAWDAELTQLAMVERDRRFFSA